MNEATRWQPYPEYKDSGVEWLGKIPAHWEMWKISHAFDQIGSGTTPPSDQYEWYEGSVPWVTTSELRETVIYDTAKKVSNEALSKFSVLKIFPKNTLLIAMYGATIGRLGLLGIEACTNQACCALVSPKTLDAKFTFYWLLGFRNQIIDLSSGGGQPNINQEKIKSLRVSAPPLPEQRAIADFLDRETAKIDSLIAKKQRLIDLLQEKRAALISRAVTRGLNPDAPMKDSGIPAIGKIPVHWDVKRNKLIFSERNERSTTGEEELLTVSHITGVTPRSQKEVYMFLAESLVDYKICYPNDLVINTMWAWMGALGISQYEGVVSPSYNVYKLKAKGTYIPQYLDLLYRTPPYICEINRYSKGIWSSRLRLYPYAFFEMHTITPPLDEQQRILDYISSQFRTMGTFLEKLQQSIEKLQEYRTALISAAVTGKIDVREQ